MARAKQCGDWVRDARMTATIANAVRMSGKPIEVASLIPRAFRPRPEPPAELTAEERAAEWAKFDTAFGIEG